MRLTYEGNEATVCLALNYFCRMSCNYQVDKTVPGFSRMRHLDYI